MNQGLVAGTSDIPSNHLLDLVIPAGMKKLWGTLIPASFSFLSMSRRLKACFVETRMNYPQYKEIFDRALI